MASQSILTFPGDGVTTQWTLNFASGYLNKADITCRVNEEVDGSGYPAYRTITWISETLVEISGAVPGVGEDVVFQRTTDNDVPINSYSGGDAFSSSAIDTSLLQLLLVTQENSDALDVLVADLGLADYPTVTSLLASTDISRGEGSQWTAGGYQYVEAAASATDAHLTTVGGVRLYVLPTEGVYHVEAWGPVSVTSFNKARQDVVRVVKPATTNFQHSPTATLKCSSLLTTDEPILVYDTENIGGVEEIMGLNVDLSSMRIEAQSGGTLSATVPAVTVKVRNGSVELPGVDCADLCSGILMDRCITGDYNTRNIVERIVDGGFGIAFATIVQAGDLVSGVTYQILETGTTDFTTVGASASTPGTVFTATGAPAGTGAVFGAAEMDNSVVRGPQFYEQVVGDAPELRGGIGVYVNAYDFVLSDLRGGWCDVPLRFGPSAAEVTVDLMHPFNGNPGTPVTDPTLIECYANGDVYITNSYLDNGLIHDFSGGNLKVQGGHFLEFASAVTLTSPYLRVYCTQALDGAQPNTRVEGCESLSVGFYDSDGNLSPGGGTYDWGGDMTAINTYFDEAELSNTSTSIVRRSVDIFTGTGDSPPERQVVTAGGRIIQEYTSSSGGSPITQRLVFDPSNGELRQEFSNNVVQGDLTVRRASGSDGNRGVTIRSEGAYNTYMDLYNGDDLKAHLFWDNVNTRTVLGTTADETLTLRTNNTDAVVIDKDQNVTIDGPTEVTGRITLKGSATAASALYVDNSVATGSYGAFRQATNGDVQIVVSDAGAVGDEFYNFSGDASTVNSVIRRGDGDARYAELSGATFTGDLTVRRASGTEGTRGVAIRSDGSFNAYMDLYNGDDLKSHIFWDNVNSRTVLGTTTAEPLVLRTNNTTALVVYDNQDVSVAAGRFSVEEADAFGHGIQIKNTANEVLDFAFSGASASANFNINYSGSGATDITLRKSGQHSMNGSWGFNEASPDVAVHVDGQIKTNPVAVASLPSASTVGAGTRAFVNDATVAAASFGTIVVGGGSNNVPVYSDGTDWRIG